MDFVVATEHKMKIQEGQKIDKILGRKIRKRFVENRPTVLPVVIDTLNNVPKQNHFFTVSKFKQSKLNIRKVFMYFIMTLREQMVAKLKVLYCLILM